MPNPEGNLELGKNREQPFYFDVWTKDNKCSKWNIYISFFYLGTN